MEFSILGPMEVRSGGRSVHIASIKQRSVLAVLLLHLNRVVSIDELIDRLWGERPPNTAPTSLHVHVSQLRKVLDRYESGAGHELVITRRPGYVLEVEAQDVDLHQFHGLAAAGRNALEEGEPSLAAWKLRAALSLWRGPALADLAFEPFAGPEVARLEEERLVALEDRIEADLAVGRAADVCGELEWLLHDHPLRERLWGQLMLALYRTGRQGDALAAYRRVADLLADELGVDPGPALKELHLAVLRQDPTLGAAGPVRRGAVRQMDSIRRRLRKRVAVLACGIEAYPGPSARSDPEMVETAFAELHALVRAEVERVGGAMIQASALEAVAVFGADTIHEDDVARAVEASLRIGEAVPRLGSATDRSALRAAVECGDALVEGPGASALDPPRVTGEPVLAAVALVRAAPPGTVLVGERAHRAAREAVKFDQEGPEQIDAGSDALLAWRAIGVQPPGGPREGGAFVGRKPELASLAAAYDLAVAERTCQAVVVVGEPGVGKSRVVAEFVDRLAPRQRPPIVRFGRCLPHGDGVVFGALGEIVRAEAGILSSDAPAEAAAKLSAAVRFSILDPADRPWIEEGLKPLVGIAGNADGASDRHSRFVAWRRYLGAIAERRPLVLVIEDLHWADRALFEFLEELVAAREHSPILALGTARRDVPDRTSGPVGDPPRAVTLPLAPLSPEDTAELLSSLLGVHALPSELQAELIDRSGGNPLHAHELIRMLIERGIVEIRGKKVTMSGLLPPDVPDSLHALIGARIDTLPEEAQDLLRDAAVVGRVFWSAAVAEVAGRDPGDVERGLEELERRDFVRPTTGSMIGGENEYTFWHVLTREVAYQQIPIAHRCAKHVAAASWFERATVGCEAEHAEIVAGHYLEALRSVARSTIPVDPDRLRDGARRSLLRAGDHAITVDADRAADLCREALQLTPPGHPERGPVLAKVAEGEHMIARLRPAIDALEEAIIVFRSQGDAANTGACLTRLSTLLQFEGETARSLSVLEDAITILEREPAGPTLASAYAEMAGARVDAGRAEDAIRWAERSLTMSTRVAADVLSARALGFRGAARAMKGESGGLDDLRAALRTTLARGWTRESTVIYVNLGEVTWPAEGPMAALAVLREAAEFAAARGMATYPMWTYSLWPLLDLGRWEEAVAMSEEVVSATAVGGAVYERVWAETVRAMAFSLQGRAEEASDLLEGVLAAARRIENLQILGPALATDAVAAVATGALVDAMRSVEELQQALSAAPIAYRARHLPELARVCAAAGELSHLHAMLDGMDPTFPRHRHAVATARAVLAEGTDRPSHAMEMYSDAARGWREFGQPLEQAYALLGLGRTLRKMGRADAIVPIREGMAMLAMLGVPEQAVPAHALRSVPGGHARTAD